MSFRPCLVIPVYNHGAGLTATLRRLAPLALPTYVVDDGSDESTQAILQTLATEHSWARHSRLPVNGGKGAAVMAGMRQAWRDGFTHVLQIDADGQHDCDDVPRFLALGQSHPEAVISGQPIYDTTVPKGRLYGRYLTHFWVWVETLSLQIGDSMCGFRLYPLAATHPLIERERIPTRMDFDIEIIVRLAWAGVPVHNLPTRVTYPPDGLSHFDMLRDNLRISWMHTRLCAGMLWRLPSLLWRRLRSAAHPPAHWSRWQERGSTWGLRATLVCHRWLGPRAVNLLLYPVVAYFMLTGSSAREASLRYLHRVALAQSKNHRPKWRDTFAHMMAFARSNADKLNAWTGTLTADSLDFPDGGHLDALLASGRGAVLISAHIGNLEMTRALAQTHGLARITAVVHTRHAQRFNDLLARVNPAFTTNLLQVGDIGPDTALMLRERIERGELLVIVGDRTPPAEDNARLPRTLSAPFLGQPAPFPQGPFVLASVLDCPVFLFFCLPHGQRHRLYLEPFSERVHLPRAQRQQHLQTLVNRYAKRLEQLCLQSPTQWFNFFDFWQPARTQTTASPQRPNTHETPPA